MGFFVPNSLGKSITDKCIVLCSYNITSFDKKVGIFTFLVLFNLNAVLFGFFLQNDRLNRLWVINGPHKSFAILFRKGV